MSDLSIDTKRDGDVALSTLAGEARLEQIGRLREDVRREMAAGAKHVLLGLSGLEFVDSASVGAFIELDDLAKATGGRLVLFGMKPRLQRMFKAMGLDARFRTAADEKAARRALAT